MGEGALRPHAPGEAKRGDERGTSAVIAAGLAKAISPARRAAFEVLMLVGAGRGHSDELLHTSRLGGLTPADKGLAMALVMGVLRWQIALDAGLRGLLTKPDVRMAEEVLVSLRLGAFQLLHMDRIPAHAALSESVELCRWSGQVHAAGMVNAVLRRMVREPVTKRPIWETTSAFAERLGHPAWLAERWVMAYGRAAAMRICEAGQKTPVEGDLFRDEARKPLDGGGAGAPSTAWDAADAELGSEPKTHGSHATSVLPVMDDGSRLVAEIAAAMAPELDGRSMRVWDCCAAPGGKTMVLAQRLGARATVLATDGSARRLRLMEDRLDAAGYGGVRCAVAEVAGLPEGDGSFDLILCDVPCSGTGTLARNPEIRHRLRLEDFARQAERQQALLRAAVGRLGKGGRLVYSTCSIEPEECEQVVEAVVAEGSVRKLNVEAGLDRLVESSVLLEKDPTMVRDGALRTLPSVHRCDGFYAAVLERT